MVCGTRGGVEKEWQTGRVSGVRLQMQIGSTLTGWLTGVLYICVTPRFVDLLTP